jgi:hypothetical protein
MTDSPGVVTSTYVWLSQIIQGKVHKYVKGYSVNKNESVRSNKHIENYLACGQDLISLQVGKSTER